MENLDFGKLEGLFNDVMNFFKSFMEELALALKGIKKVYGWSKKDEEAGE